MRWNLSASVVSKRRQRRILRVRCRWPVDVTYTVGVSPSSVTLHRSPKTVGYRWSRNIIRAFHGHRNLRDDFVLRIVTSRLNVSFRLTVVNAWRPHYRIVLIV